MKKLLIAVLCVLVAAPAFAGRVTDTIDILYTSQIEAMGSDADIDFPDTCNFSGTVSFASATLTLPVFTLANGLALDNDTNNVFEWNENSEEIKWTFNTNELDLSSGTGVVTFSFLDNAAATLTHAADGAAEDFTISQTGAQDSSLVISSAGTGADALTISTSAGGMDLTVAGSAAGEDLDLTSASSINLVATEAAADQIKLDAQGTIAGNALNLETSDGGIIINAVGASNGDLTLQSGDDTSITATGTVAIDSADWDISATGAATNMASVGFDSSTVIYHDTVEITATEIKALAATPKVLVAAPGAGKFIEVVSAVLVLDYGSEVFAEDADNCVIQYTTSGDDITGSIEMTGFIDQAADTIMVVYPSSPLAANAATDMLNNSVELLNANDNFTGNASDDGSLTVKIAYRIHDAGL